VSPGNWTGASSAIQPQEKSPVGQHVFLEGLPPFGVKPLTKFLNFFFEKNPL